MGGVSLINGQVSGGVDGSGSGFDVLCLGGGSGNNRKYCCQNYGTGCAASAPPAPANPAPPGNTPTPTSPGADPTLAFTQSAYGGVVPIVFGSDLVSGNIIWASPFVKHTYTDGDSIKFYYSTSIAIAVCEGVIDHLLRMYVGDQLVLDNTTEVNPDGTPVASVTGAISSLSVDLTSPTSPLVVIAPDQRKTRITIYSGREDQTPPAVMSQQEGYEYTPGYRGIAYLLIENFLVTDSVPSISIEISANTESLYPRIYGDISSDVVLTGGTFGPTLYIPGYDIFYTGARSVPTGRNNGLRRWDGNTLALEHSWLLSNNGNTDSSLQAPKYFKVLTSGNLLLVTGSLGSSPGYGTYSPFSEALIDATGACHSNGAHISTSPASSNDGVLVTRGVDENGNECDIVICLSYPLGTSRCNVAMLTIADNGKISYPFFVNDDSVATTGITKLWGGGVVGAIYAVPKAISDKTPKFPDGGASFGKHAYYFSIKTSADTAMYVDRLDFDVQSDGAVSVAAPRMTATDTIPFTDLYGVRVDPIKAFACPSDNTIIVCCDTFSGEDEISGVIFKYDPINARIVWKTPLYGTTFISGDYWEFGIEDDVSNDKFAWIEAGGNDIWAIDLDTGVAGKVLSLTDQGMSPTNSGGYGHSRYDGREDSILTWGNTDATALQKIFLSRVNRAQVPLSTIIKSLLGRVDWRVADIDIQGLDTLAVDGYTISSGSYTLRQAFNELQQVFTFDVIESNGEIVYKQRGNSAAGTVFEGKMQAVQDGATGWLQETHEYDFAGARKLSITYRDVDREYKSNVQSIQLPKYDNSLVDEDAAIAVQVPIVLTADKAKKLAEILLYAKITYQAGYTGALPYGNIKYDPSDVVTFSFRDEDALDDVTLRLRQTSIGADYTFQFTATREDPDIYVDQVNLFGTLGRYVPKTLPTPATRVDFLPLPIPFWSETLAQDNDARPTLYPVYATVTSLTGASTKPPKDTMLVIDETDTQYQLPPFSQFPTWGFVMGTLPAHPEYYTTDFTNTFRVKMVSTAGATLGSCSDYYDMLNNRKKCLAMIGGEVVQFQTATDLGDGVWEFSVIRRALFGTEIESSQHIAGERFVLLYGSDGLFSLGNSIVQVNVGLGDGMLKFLNFTIPNARNPAQPDYTAAYLCKQFRPYMPSAGQINYSGDDAVVSWKRRSRYNGQWTDDGSEADDVPFTDASPLISVPEFDLYLTTTPATFNPADATTFLRKVTVTDAETFTYTSAMQTEDGFVNTTTTLTAVVLQTVSKTGLDSSNGLLFSGGPKN